MPSQRVEEDSGDDHDNSFGARVSPEPVQDLKFNLYELHCGEVFEGLNAFFPNNVEYLTHGICSRLVVHDSRLEIFCINYGHL